MVQRVMVPVDGSPESYATRVIAALDQFST
jgi:hypothetical protein